MSYELEYYAWAEMAWVTLYSVSALNCLHKDLHWTGVINVFEDGICNRKTSYRCWLVHLGNKEAFKEILHKRERGGGIFKNHQNPLCQHVALNINQAINKLIYQEVLRSNIFAK